MSKHYFAVYGASGFGREIMPVLKKQYKDHKNVEFVFIDDAESIATHCNGYQVFKFRNFLALTGEKSAIIAIADSSIRKVLTEKCEHSGINVINVVAENVVIMDEVSYEDGVILSSFVTLTSNIKIGKSFHANIYSYVGHDCVIGDFVTFAPSVKCNGNVYIEDDAYIGTGAIIKQGTPLKPMIIGKGAMVGMGSVVTKSVAAGDVVFGVPAKSLKRKK
jgi:sugar O-acyltransferase (sialic acid O-acetyltransferase NeuD family)